MRAIRFATAQSAAAALRAGALLAHPTQGLWGIAAAPSHADGVATLDQLKARAPGRGYIAVAGSAAAFGGWYAPDPMVNRLLSERFEGPVTVICMAGPAAPAPVQAGDGTVALRVDEHPAVCALSAALGGPLLSTSLNLPGRAPASGPDDLDPDLAAALAGVFERSPAPTGQASTLVAWRPPSLVALRVGAVSVDVIRDRVAADLRPAANESMDILLRGRIHLIQALKGYRSSVDAMALAWFACRQAPVPTRALDLGAGTGLVGILLAMRHRQAEVHLVERQGELAGRAARNLRLNNLQDRAHVHLWDIAEAAPSRLPAMDLIACNPPYHSTVGRMLPADVERREAHYESTADLDRFALVASDLLAEGGSLCLIYPGERLELAVQALANAGMGRIDVARLYHRAPLERATRVLLHACKAENLERRELAPLPLHSADHDDHLYAQDIEDFIAELGPPTAPETR